MKFIDEGAIDLILSRYEDERSFNTDLESMAKDQAELMTFIDQENYSLLTNEEMDLVQYMTLVIYTSCCLQSEKKLIIPAKELESKEEENWNTFNTASGKSFSKILDVFFKDYFQEDLLAFVEDSLESDEEHFVTPVGREIIFVACKSIIDVIDENNGADPK